ncbi:MAG: nucleoside triphosphate pyrophosphohydrolase family protein [Bacteroidota bacterium]
MSFIKHINKVKEFHESFNIVNNEQPTLLSKEEFLLRYNLIKEENEEYLNACEKGDIIEIADALGDILYIALGTLLRHGLQHKIDEVFEEIHRSNMSKLGPDGKPIYREDGKVLKGPNYFKPDIKKILNNNG